MYYPTPDYLKRCYKAAGRTGQFVATGQVGNINISDITTRLIQTAGRFTEHYASDLLYDIDHIIAMTSKHKVMPGEDVIIAAGFRENGVDHNAFLMNRLQESLSYVGLSGYPDYARHYRKIYAVRIENAYEPDSCFDQVPGCTVTLRDITHNLVAFQDSDKNWNPDEEVNAYLARNPEYAGMSEEEANCYAVRGF